MATSDGSECFTYLRCPTEAAPLWIELGCISTETVNHSLQTSNKPICRNNKTIQKRIDGVETNATWQLEDLDDSFRPLSKFLRRAAKKCKEVEIAYLDAEITDPDVDGDVIAGAMSYTGQRNVNDKNVQITHENTGGSLCWDEFIAGGGGVATGEITDLPLVV